MSHIKKASDGGAPSPRRTARRGAFSAGVTALAVAAVIVFNLLTAQLSDSAVQFDMSGSGIYHITDTSVDYLSAVTEDVAIHVLANKDNVDSRIVRFLSKYEDLSDHLSVEYTDPAVYPSVLKRYDAALNDVVVVCEATGRQEVFSLDEVIDYDVMAYYYNGTYTETAFDAEGLLTSAVDGVLTDSARRVYETTGHSETALSAAVTGLLKKAHMTAESVNLLTDGGIPADCDLLVLNAPGRDLADDELAMIQKYLADGGQVIYTMASQDLDLPNFDALCAQYGMTVADGIIMDGKNYYQNNPLLFFPAVDTAVDAAAALSADPLVLFYTSRGMTLTDPARDTVSVSSFLTTSDAGYAAVDESTRVQGTYSVGAVATEPVGEKTARLTVFGCDSPVNESLTGSFTNLDNLSLFMGAATAGFEDVSAISIEPVDLSEPMNTVTTGGLWALVFIFVIPLALLICGFVRWMHRRKL